MLRIASKRFKAVRIGSIVIGDEILKSGSPKKIAKNFEKSQKVSFFVVNFRKNGAKSKLYKLGPIIVH